MKLTQAEEQVLETLTKAGYNVLRNGWPDFLAVKDEKAFGVEVKYGADTVKPRQAAMHEALESLGLPVHVVNPDNKDKLLTKHASSMGRAVAVATVQRELRHERRSLVQQIEKAEGLVARVDWALASLDVLSDSYLQFDGAAVPQGSVIKG